jgi:hypothetical protein
MVFQLHEWDIHIEWRVTSGAGVTEVRSCVGLAALARKCRRGPGRAGAQTPACLFTVACAG